MADERPASTAVGGGTLSAEAVRVMRVEEGFPPATLPTVFADGVVNVAPSASVIRFYLYRADPEQTGKGEYQNQAVVQIVMPVLGFVQMATFFEKAVKQFA